MTQVQHHTATLTKIGTSAIPFFEIHGNDIDHRAINENIKTVLEQISLVIPSLNSSFGSTIASTPSRKGKFAMNTPETLIPSDAYEKFPKIDSMSMFLDFNEELTHDEQMRDEYVSKK